MTKVTEITNEDGRKIRIFVDQVGTAHHLMIEAPDRTHETILTALEFEALKRHLSGTGNSVDRAITIQHMIKAWNDQPDNATIEDRMGAAMDVARVGTVPSDWAAKHLAPAGADGWMPWSGGKCPVAWGTPLQIRLRDGRTYFAQAKACYSYRWHHDQGTIDITEYRIALRVR
jgi:hypothetical protein